MSVEQESVFAIRLGAPPTAPSNVPNRHRPLPALAVDTVSMVPLAMPPVSATSLIRLESSTLLKVDALFVRVDTLGRLVVIRVHHHLHRVLLLMCVLVVISIHLHLHPASSLILFLHPLRVPIQVRAI